MKFPIVRTKILGPNIFGMERTIDEYELCCVVAIKLSGNSQKVFEKLME